MTEQNNYIKAEAYQKKRQKIAEAVSLMDKDDLDELQEWIAGRIERDMSQALIESINTLISDMDVKTLEDIEGYIARIED